MTLENNQQRKLKRAINLLTQPFIWLKKNITTRQHPSKTPNHAAYRLISFDTGTDNKSQLTIHITGTSSTLKLTAEEILKDDNIIKKFNHSDIRTITYLACQLPTKRQKLIAQRFCVNAGKMIFTINCENGNHIEVTAHDISKDKHLLQQLSPEEAHTIGFTTATEWAGTKVT